MMPPFPLLPLRHPVADVELGEDVGGAIGFVTRLGTQALGGAFPIKPPAWSIIQQPVPHGPDHDLLLRAKTQLALYAVEGVPYGHRLDSPGLRNRVV